MMNQTKHISSKARLFSILSTTLLLTIVGMVFELIAAIGDPKPETESAGCLSNFFSIFFGTLLTVVIIVLIHRFFLGFFKRAMPSMTDSQKQTETQQIGAP